MRNALRAAAAVLAIVVGSSSSAISAGEMVAGELREARFPAGDKTITLRFRGCPSGVLIPGDPTKPNPHPPVPMEAFYIGETEITFQEIGDLLGNEKRLAIADRVNADDPKGAFKNLTRDPKLPAFGVNVPDVIELCRKLNALSDANAGGDVSGIESRRFRLPSHYEWQYACRAESTAPVTRPHFHGWPDGDRPHDQMDPTIKAKSLELWRECGAQDGPFVGSQIQLAKLCRVVKSGDESKQPLEVLRVYLRSGLGLQQDLSRSIPADVLVLEPPRSGLPNAWQIHDMHASVSEWTLAIPDRDELAKFWGGLIAADGDVRRNGDRKFFLAGGHFHKTIYPNEETKTPRWSCFAIWGGSDQTIGNAGDTVNFDPSTGEIKPFSLKELVEEAPDLLGDETPGVRLVLERTLNERWLRVVRGNIRRVNGRSDDLDRDFELWKETIAQIVPPGRRSAVLATLERYRALSLYGRGDVKLALNILRSLDHGTPGDDGDDLYHSLVNQAIHSDEGDDADPSP